LATIGTLTVNGTVTLGGTTAMRLNKTAVTSDNLTVFGTVNYGGTLSLTNISGTLAPGDSFQLFTASAYNGTFANIVPAAPGFKLVWNTNNLSSGILSITGPPSITNFTLTGSSLVLQGGFGPASAPYTVLASTNVALPVNQWTPIATSAFDGSGNFEFTTNITALPRQFFMISTP
jgi:hypothetical protein